MINKAEFWSFAHTNQEILQELLAYSGASFDSDIGWLKYFISETPNGSLFQKNVLFDVIRNQKVHLAHITTNLPTIEADGRLLSSSGCMVGSVYCTPVIQEGEKLRLHNLGEYILLNEASRFSKNKNVDLLLIELESTHPTSRPAVGIDYLKLGQVHFHVFSELSYLLSHDELSELKLGVVDSIKKVSTLLSIVEEHTPESLSQNLKEFYELYRQSTTELPILGYILFEVLCEYIALFQKGEQVDRYKEVGEIYCANFKNMLFDLSPDTTRSFDLGSFRPSLADVLTYMNSIGILNSKNSSSFEIFLTRRLCYLISSRFYNVDSDANLKKSFWKNIEWDFEYLQHQITPLLGDTIHRFLRNMHRYPNFHFYFDQYKALQAWNYWNHASIALPYNAILPKGEIGINPANPYMKYSVFTTKSYQENGFTYLKKDREIPLVIEPRLAELNMLLMRKRA